MRLQSERLTYQKCTKADLNDYLKFGMNKQVMRYVTYKALSRKEAEERYQKALNINDQETKLGYWLAYNKQSGALIAYLKIIHIGNNQHEIGYLLLPDHWGKQYATELTAALVEYAKDIKEVTELVGIVDTRNAASKRVLEKNGFLWYKKEPLNGHPVDYLKRPS